MQSMNFTMNIRNSNHAFASGAPYVKTKEQKKIETISKRTPQRVRLDQKPSKCITITF